jgi:hypothetical protein
MYNVLGLPHTHGTTGAPILRAVAAAASLLNFSRLQQRYSVCA